MGRICIKVNIFLRLEYVTLFVYVLEDLRQRDTKLMAFIVCISHYNQC